MPQSRGPAYRKARREFIAKYELHGGWWACWMCGRQTQHIELDHIQRTSMGGSNTRLMDKSNWQLICRTCHAKKDSGFRFA